MRVLKIKFKSHIWAETSLMAGQPLFERVMACFAVVSESTHVSSWRVLDCFLGGRWLDGTESTSHFASEAECELDIPPPSPQWKRNKTTLLENSQKILSALLARTDVGARGEEVPPSSKEVISKCFQQLSESYDEEYGGFSESPKFPTPG